MSRFSSHGRGSIVFKCIAVSVTLEDESEVFDVILLTFTVWFYLVSSFWEKIMCCIGSYLYWSRPGFHFLILLLFAGRYWWTEFVAFFFVEILCGERASRRKLRNRSGSKFILSVSTNKTHMFCKDFWNDISEQICCKYVVSNSSISRNVIFLQPFYKTPSLPKQDSLVNIYRTKFRQQVSSNNNSFVYMSCSWIDWDHFKSALKNISIGPMWYSVKQLY